MPSAKADTLVLPELEVQASREFFFVKDNKTYRLDSFRRQWYGNNHLGDLLQYSSFVHINNYGMGASSTFSIRGTADDQSAVLWNGINIRSLSLGSTDVSIIPVHEQDQISVITNSASSIYGSGTFGGAILINNAANWNNRFTLNGKYDFGNFNSHKGDLSLAAGNEKIQFQTYGTYHKATNNFRYYDAYKPGQPLSVLQHNALENLASISNLFWRPTGKILIQAGSWTQQKYKEIPAIMGGSPVSSKWQEDFTTKNYFYFQQQTRKGVWYNRAALVYDRQLYSDSLFGIDASYAMYKLTNSINYRHYFKNRVILDAGADYYYDRAKITNYHSIVNEQRAGLFAGVKYNKKEWTFSASVRQEIHRYRYFRPLFSAEIVYNHPSGRIQTGINYADKYRIPDLNDKYWQPGGNPELTPENGWTLEWNQQFELLPLHHKHQLQFSYSGYYTRIKDNIVWTPLTATLWSPRNVKNTQHTGIEARLSNMLQATATIRIHTSILYHYNHSTVTKDYNPLSEGNFIRYKPQHSLKINTSLEDRNFMLGFNYNYISARFTDEENNPFYALKAYHLLDMFIGFKLSYKSFTPQFQFQVNNLLNTRYETIRSYAQPLRNFQIRILFNYTTPKSKKND